MIHSLSPVVLVGPMKSGTTWVHEYLKARGDVCLPFRTKEIFFFDRYYERGLDWYRGQFRPNLRHRLLVDVSPGLFTNDAAPGRVRDVFPDAEIIVLRRDPVARSWSHYLHLKRYGYTKSPFDVALKDCPEILEASRYDKWVRRWEDEFGRSKVHVVSADDLGRDARAFASRIDDALGLPTSVADPVAIGKINAAAQPRSFALSRAARNASYFLRDIHLDPLVAIARDLGLNRLVYSRSGSSKAAAMSEIEAGLIRERLLER